jgi:hypothetical protein
MVGNNYAAFQPKDAPPEVSSTPFSEFIRTESSEEKKKTPRNFPETRRRLRGVAQLLWWPSPGVWAR